MATVFITVPNVYSQVKLVLQGVPDDGTVPISTIDGSEAPSLYYMFPEAVFGTGRLQGPILGNDRISAVSTNPSIGEVGTFYTVTITDLRSQELLYEADFEITGDVFDMEVEGPIVSFPVPGVSPVPNDAVFVSKTYVDDGDAASVASAEAYTNTHSIDISGKADISYVDSSVAAGDAATLAAAEAYSDANQEDISGKASVASVNAEATRAEAAEALLAAEIPAGDAVTLSSAQAYTDAHAGVSSVAGKNGAVTLVESDIAGLPTDLSTLSTSVGTEATARVAGDATNATAIASEATRALAAEALLASQSALTAETGRATSVEGGIESDLATLQTQVDNLPSIPPAPARASVAVTTGSLAAAATETLSVTLGKSFILLSVQVNKKARVELYSTAAARTADATRAIGTAPAAGTAHGVICDLALLSAQTFIMSPIAMGANMEGSVTNAIAYAITNTDTTAQAITVTFTFLALET